MQLAEAGNENGRDERSVEQSKDIEKSGDSQTGRGQESELQTQRTGCCCDRLLIAVVHGQRSSTGTSKAHHRHVRHRHGILNESVTEQRWRIIHLANSDTETKTRNKTYTLRGRRKTKWNYEMTETRDREATVEQSREIETRGGSQTGQEHEHIVNTTYCVPLRWIIDRRCPSGSPVQAHAPVWIFVKKMCG